MSEDRVSLFEGGMGLYGFVALGPVRWQKEKSMKRNRVIAGLSVLLVAMVSPAAALPVMPERQLRMPSSPDLIVEGPAVSQGSSGWKNHTWIVRNNGKGDSTQSSLVVTCQEVYTEKAKKLPGYYEECADRKTAVVPPLQKDGGSAPIVITDAARYYEADKSKFRLRFTATVDPGGANSESNERNNQAVFTDENFSGPPPLPPPPGFKSGVVSRPGALGLPKPQVTLKTQNPWVPGQPVWIQVTNSGLVDAPAFQVSVSCERRNFKRMQGKFGSLGKTKECDFYALPTAALELPDGLAVGKWKSIWLLQVKSESGPLPEHEVKFLTYGVDGNPLVLKNY